MPFRTTALPVVAAALLVATAAAQSPPWSYRPLQRPAVPAGEAGDAAWCRSPLDAFARAGMRAHGLEPAADADRATWLRRVALDLTGLPPTPEEVAAFVADAAPGADARQVDRLLATPAFAERWAMWWLDLARYADSQGYEKDGLRRTMWRYRDWVIDAFARDLPFDRFTVEQLAGDLLPGATDEQRLATAFHRQTMTNTEGGTDDEEFRSAAVVDRVNTTLGVWMGTTIGCAQCHDHKYDPIAQKDFYRLYAYFDQTADRDQPDDSPALRVPTAAQRAAQKAIELELTALRAKVVVDDATLAGWIEGQVARQRAFAAAAPEASVWRVLGPIEAADLHAAHTTAFAPETEGVKLDAEQAGRRWREEKDYDDGRVHGWRGDRSAFYLFRTIEAAAAVDVVLSLGSDDALAVWWNGREVLRKEVGRAAAADQELLPVALQKGRNTLLLKVSNGDGPGGFFFDLRATALGETARSVLADPPLDETAREILRREYLAAAPELAGIRAKIAAVEADFEAQRGPAVPVLQELPAAQRRATHVHVRGSFLAPGDVVEPAIPACWPPLPKDAPHDRLGFARWLVSRDNPLTARVLTNRIWSELWGRGLVATLEDFGNQGERPTHPGLLDWLACEFVESGWSLRHLLRTIVLSRTYGQSSAVPAAARALDPDDTWLARGASFRLAAETLRDQALAVSGLLAPAVGGPSVMPPQPDGVWLQIYSGEQWVAATGPDRHRRGLYTFWRRTSPHPAMLVLDAQSREACVLRRARTNTPLQALVLWNDPEFHEAAEALGARAAGEAKGASGGENAALVVGVGWLFGRCLLRAPTTSETARLLALWRDERAAGADDRAAWTALAGVVTNLDEFLTRR